MKIKDWLQKFNSGVKNKNVLSNEEKMKTVTRLENFTTQEKRESYHTQWMKKIVDTNEKIENGNFTSQDVEQFLNDFYFGYVSSSSGSHKKSREILLNKIKPQVMEYFGVNESEICFGDYCPNLEEKYCPYKVVMGDLELYNSNLKDLGQLKFIGGKANFYNSKIETLGNLEMIAGDVARTLPCDIDLGNLRKIGGSVDFADTNFKSLGKLQEIGGSARFYNVALEDLGDLKIIGGCADFSCAGVRNDYKLKSLGNLESVGECLNISFSNIEDLGKLQLVKGNMQIFNSKIKTMKELKQIGGDLNAENSNLEDLGCLEYIGGNAYLHGSLIKTLKNLKYIGGVADLRIGALYDFGKLKKIGGSLKLNELQLYSNEYELKYESIIGDFRHIVCADQLSVVGDDIFLYQKTDEKYEKITYTLLKELINKNNRIYKKIKNLKDDKELTK